MIWNERIETMPLEDLKNLQSERLVNLVRYVYDNCPSIRKLKQMRRPRRHPGDRGYHQTALYD